MVANSKGCVGWNEALHQYLAQSEHPENIRYYYHCHRDHEDEGEGDDDDDDDIMNETNVADCFRFS